MYDQHDPEECHALITTLCSVLKGQPPRPVPIEELVELWNNQGVPDAESLLAKAADSLKKRQMLVEEEYLGQPGYRISVDLFRHWWASEYPHLGEYLRKLKAVPSRTGTSQRSAAEQVLVLLQGRKSENQQASHPGDGPPFALQSYPHDCSSWEVLKATPLMSRIVQLSKPNEATEHAWHTEDLGDLMCTLKALFYLFQRACPDHEAELSWPKIIDGLPRTSPRPVRSAACLGVIMRILVQPPPGLKVPDPVLKEPGIFLPSWPGIRFLVAVANFIDAALHQTETEENLASLDAWRVYADRVELDWSKDSFPKTLLTRLNNPDTHTKGNVIGCLEKLERCEVSIPTSLDKQIRDYLSWEACVSLITFSSAGKTLRISWTRDNHAAR
jgi:hypothetical protein